VSLYGQRTIIGTVSQAAGVPSGALIGRGSNANGDYARFAAGTQICHRRAFVSLAISTAAFGGFVSAHQTWTFPAAFTSLTALGATSENNSAFGAVFTSAVRPTGNTWAVTSVSSQAAAGRTVGLLAVGSWF